MSIVNVTVIPKNMVSIDYAGEFTPFDINIKIQNRAQAALIMHMLCHGIRSGTRLLQDIGQRATYEAGDLKESCYQLTDIDAISPFNV